MIARRSGHIINIASLSGLIPVPGQVVYVGAKFGVVGLSAALADEMAPHGVDVSVIMPPFTNTELISGTAGSGAIKPVEPEDIAKAVIKTLDKPKTHVAVPPPLRFTAQAAQMLGPRGRRWLNKQARTGPRVPRLRHHRAADLRAARASRTGRRRGPREKLAELRDRAAHPISLDHVEIREQLLEPELVVIGGTHEHDVDDLGIVGASSRSW